MAGSMYSYFLFILCYAACSAYAQVQFFSSPAEIGNTTVIPDACLRSLQLPIECNPAFTYNPNSEPAGPFDKTLQDDFCSPTCGASLANISSIIHRSCPDTPTPWPNRPAAYGVDRLWAYQNRTCLKDPKTQDYCTNINAKWQEKLPDHDLELADLPKDQLCSSCFMDTLRLMQGTEYSSYDPVIAKQFKASQKVCGVDYPTEVQGQLANATMAIPTSAMDNFPPKSTECASGKHTKVAKGDTCQSIAEANNVNTAALRIANDVFPSCSNLKVDSTLCMPNSCKTYKVKQGETCMSVAQSAQLSWTNIISFNPTLNFQCTNLIAGENICLSPPAGWYKPVRISYPVPQPPSPTMSRPLGTGATSRWMPGTWLRPTGTGTGGLVATAGNYTWSNGPSRMTSSCSDESMPVTVITLDTTITYYATASGSSIATETTAVDTIVTVPKVHLDTLTISASGGYPSQTIALEAGPGATHARCFLEFAS